jgi:hypothetical protein
MAIYKLMQNTVFEPKDIERLVTAYEQTLRALYENFGTSALPVSCSHPFTPACEKSK